MSEGILKKIDETAENLDINAIPEELHLLPRDMMVEWLEDKENEKPNSSKKPKLNEQRFGQTVTSIKMLKQYSKGFVPKNGPYVTSKHGVHGGIARVLTVHSFQILESF